MKHIFVLIGLVLWPLVGLVHGAIPASERAALIALYNNTNGDNWTKKSGWKTAPLYADGFAMPGTEGSWHGVTVDSNQVTYLSLATNQLNGSIPSQLGNLTGLNGLDMHENKLNGSIPSQLGNLIKLRTLLLYSNQLTGSIPAQLGNITGLEWLMLNNNQLSGNIPSQLGYLSKLSYLQLHYNELSGNIPSQFGSLTKLMSLLLNHNHLTGVIPTTLTNLTHIMNFDIGYNCLSATNAALRTWLNSHDADWEATQCLTVPIITTNPITSITATSAVSGGNVSADGGSQVAEKGICWGTTINPTTGDSREYNGVGTGSFTSNITGLSANTLYYVRAYAINVVGTAYGENISFTTPSNLPELQPPFGSFDTPLDGSTVAGSIAVTGWALDDGGLASVKLYLLQGNTPTYIGDALFVEGARPDVAGAYPEYPANTKAGWGYMMLTNFLPGEGNGTFVISAVATDLVGKTTELGTKTIIVDNAHAVKPFGAIDTPTQGGTASGSAFINWGWVLTPQPNSIPTSGSTINVWVDGVNKGQPTYNIYRSDIATLFPGYANSNGAIGYFYLDTTKYTNAVHTIQWTATDNADNSDGIGSRYFTIQNTSSDVAQSAATRSTNLNLQQISSLPEDSAEPIYFSKGFYSDNECSELLPDEKGNHPLSLKELERVEIQLGQTYADIQGYLINGNLLHKLPIGSTLDKKSGTFSWSPGPGFLGSYSLVFVLTETNGLSFKKSVEIKIEPKYNN